MSKVIGVKRMKFELENLDLIDLISERHVLLRKITEKSWNDNNDIYISNSEWFILVRIYKKHPTISYVSKQIGISRQATHKLIKSLKAKGLIEITNSENNNRDKCLRLTPLGEDCYAKNTSLKVALEQKIAQKIGAEQLAVLKDILKSDWEL